MKPLPAGVVDIRGKEYQTVALRVHNFRDEFQDYSLTTELIHRDAECVVMRAVVAAPDGRVLATGHAEEWRADGKINAVAALENAETSAIGRALAAFGLGGTEFASADEVARAVSGAKAHGGSARDALREDFERFGDEVQRFMRAAAARIGAKTTGAEALAEYDLATASIEHDDNSVVKNALWYLLDAQTRASIKRAGSKKEAA